MKILKTKLFISFLTLLFFSNTNLLSWTKLMKASCRGSLRGVKKALEENLDNIRYCSEKNSVKEVYVNSKRYEQLFPKGCDAFTIAALCGYQEIAFEIFKKLEDDYSPPIFADYGVTSLMIAVMSGIKSLIQREFEKNPTELYNTVTQTFGKFPRGTSLVNIALWTKNQDVITLIQGFYLVTTALRQESYQPSDLTLGVCLKTLHDQYE